MAAKSKMEWLRELIENRLEFPRPIYRAVILQALTDLERLKKPIKSEKEFLGNLEQVFTRFDQKATCTVTIGNEAWAYNGNGKWSIQNE